MDLLGKKKLLESLRKQVEELRDWMFENSSPDVPISEFEKIANKHAILSIRIHIIEKQW